MYFYIYNLGIAMFLMKADPSSRLLKMNTRKQKIKSNFLTGTPILLTDKPLILRLRTYAKYPNSSMLMKILILYSRDILVILE